jgi:starch synthase (maltosyl-transferring)
MYNGFELCEAAALPGREEYANSEKYEYKVWDWDRPGNIVGFVTRLNRLRRDNPALHHIKNLRFYGADNDQVLFYGKIAPDRRNAVFVAVNLDPTQAQEAHIDMPLDALGIAAGQPYRLDDLLLGHSWTWTGRYQHLRLEPASNPVAIFRVRDLEPAAPLP